MSISQNFPNTRPSLNLNFARSKTLDPRITFSRPQTGNGVTYVGEDGLIKYASADEPRFDHDPETGECLGLLIEESRSNLLANNNDWTSPAKTTANVTITSNAGISPDGGLNATRLQETSATNVQRRWYGNIGTVSSYNTMTWSVFVKPDGNRKSIGLYPNYGGSGFLGEYNLQDLTYFGSFVGGGNAIDASQDIKVYPNGWYKLIVTITFNTAQTGMNFYGYFSGNLDDANDYYDGDGSSGILLWGEQIEPGPSPTSYIPRPDASTATRNPDSVTMTGDNFSDWYNPSEGTVFVDSLVKYNPNETKFVWSLYGGSIDHSLRQPHLTGLRFRAVIGGAFTPAPGTGFNATNGSTTKAAVAYDSTTGRLQVGTSGDDVTMIGTADPTIFKIGPHNGTISQLTYYPVRLPNSTLQTLTK
jgi:hypothetical protein